MVLTSNDSRTFLCKAVLCIRSQNVMEKSNKLTVHYFTDQILLFLQTCSVTGGLDTFGCIYTHTH